ncbi:MAG TPA: hypothetical protein VFJ85_12110 [Acidimicrobiales bacterium]|nr:hypothetical protein [Acidimicrobiales bacterium]
MLASITPLGERARGNRWWRTAAALAAGSVLGGWALGAAAGGAGALAAVAVGPLGVAGVVVAVLAAAAGVAELAGWRAPTARRQVDEAWIGRYRGWVYGAGFGLQLGAGVLTTVTTAAVYAVVAAGAVLGAAGAPGWAQVAGAAFGAARAVPVLAGARLRDPDAVRRRGARLAAAAGAGRVVAGSTLCAAGVWAAARWAG